MAPALRRSGKMEADVFLYNNNFVIKEKSKKAQSLKDLMKNDLYFMCVDPWPY